MLEPVRVFDFVERISALGCVDEIVADFEREAGLIGITHVALGALPKPGSVELEPFFLSTWPEPWADYYVDEGFARIDPGVLHCATSLLPASWSGLRKMYGGSEGHRRVIEETEDAGWTEGLAIPIHGPNGYRGMVGAVGGAKQLSPGDRTALHLMGIYLHERLKELMAPSLAPTPLELPRLTKGEIECIKWLLAGKSDWEIGEILRISQSAAHWRIEHAKQKLGVKTRAQLTALDVHFGYVRP